MCTSIMRRIFSLHPVKFAVLLMLLVVTGVAVANLTSHTEALLDALILAIDSDADGTITDETWYSTFNGKQDAISFGAGTEAALGNAPDAAGGFQSVLAEGAFADGDKTKLDGIEALADVTDAANVAAAGALMTSALGSGTETALGNAPDAAGGFQSVLTEGPFVAGDKTEHDTMVGSGAQAVGVADTPVFGDVTLGVSTSLTGSIKLKNSSNSYTLTIQPGATSQNWAITYPTAPPAGNDYAMVMSTGGVVSYIDTATLGGTPALNTVGDAAAQWTVDSGTYQHLITVGTAGEWRWQVDGSNYISIINDGGVMRLKGVGTSTIDTGTVTLADEAIFGQTGTASGDYFTMAAYDEDDTQYVDLLYYVNGNAVYGYLGNPTNGMKWDEDGAVSFVGTGSLQIPSGTNPTVDSEGKIAYETDEEGIRVYDGAANRLLGTVITKSYTILQPDLVQAETDDLIIGHFDARWYPFGVKMLGYTISASASSSDTYLLEEWDDEVGSTQATSESIALSTATRAEDDGTLSDSDFAADSYLNVNFDDAQDDISFVTITYAFYVKTGD